MDIKTIEFDLINKCNLSCPLCLRNFEQFSKFKKEIKYVKLEDIIQFVNNFNNLESVKLMGTTSEPTLHPNFLDITRYLVSNNIPVKISTNGCTHNKEFWETLGSILHSDSEILFAIDGSTQEIYEKYRVGGSLSKVLENYKYFSSNSQASTGLQFIFFEHNENDYENVVNLARDNNFDFIDLLECNDTNKDRIKKLGIGPRPSIQKGFYDIRDKMQKHDKFGNIDCLSIAKSEIFIGYNSRVYPCSNMFEQDLVEKDAMFLTDVDVMDRVQKYLDDRHKCYECFNACSVVGHALEKNHAKERIYFARDK